MFALELQNVCVFMFIKLGLKLPCKQGSFYGAQLCSIEFEFTVNGMMEASILSYCPALQALFGCMAAVTF